MLLLAAIILIVLGLALLGICVLAAANSPIAGGDEVRSMTSLAALLAFVGAALLAWWLWAPTAARAHEAPTGWSYPMACCSGFDCREAAAAEVVEGARGFEIVATGELIPIGDPRIKQSQDGRVHVCCKAGDFDNCALICLIVPPRSY